MNSPYLNTNELCHVIQRTPDYISAMKRSGYKPAIEALNLHTLDGERGAVTWLQEHPKFRYRDAYPKSVKKIRKDSTSVRRLSPPSARKSVEESKP